MSTATPNLGYTLREQPRSLVGHSRFRFELTVGVWPDEMGVRVDCGDAKIDPSLSTTGFGSISPTDAARYGALLAEAVRLIAAHRAAEGWT